MQLLNVTWSSRKNPPGNHTSQLRVRPLTPSPAPSTSLSSPSSPRRCLGIGRNIGLESPIVGRKMGLEETLIDPIPTCRGFE